jgi:benzoyl-CoA reductase/2-hydroxyglutaryl-CoA dehydratase subunit BcrC/BadD/HgdB
MNVSKLYLFCGAYPIELIESFDIPWEFSSNDTATGEWEIHVMPAICEYLKKQIDFARTTEYSCNYAFIMQNHCNAMERLYDIYNMVFNEKKCHLFQHPRISGSLGKQFFKTQLLKLIPFLESISGKKYDHKNLKYVIEKSKRRRHLFENIKKLIALGLFNYNIYRKYMKMIRSGGLSIQKESEIEKFLTDISLLIDKYKYQNRKGKVILIVGSVLHSYDYFNILHKKGYYIIPIFNNLTPFDGKFSNNNQFIDPLDELVEVYIDHKKNVRHSDNDEYYKYVMSCIENYRAKAIIFFNVKYCTLNSFDYDNILPLINKEKIHSLSIEDSYGKHINAGSINRINAFLETI